MAQLTVMTWNVRNLFRPDAGDGGARADYEEKLSGLAEVIDQVDPDVLALQEVGGEEVLADLDDRCATDFDNRVVGSTDDRGIRVALLSPRRLSNRTNRTAFPDGIAPVQERDLRFDDPDTADNEAMRDETRRGILSATLWSGDHRVTVITCHLKSKLITYPPVGESSEARFFPFDERERLRYAGYALFQRTAEAMTCRVLLNAALFAEGDEPGTGDGTGTQVPVILLGDLNDEPRAATTQIIQGPGGSEIDFRPGSGFQRPDAGDGYRMWNLHRLLSDDGPTGTRVYRGRSELVDHIFASHFLVNPGNLPTVEIVPATALPSMDDDPTVPLSAPSDHAAVVATFTV